MNYLDKTFPTPAENLALEEVLLDACERGEIGQVLRFWESASHFAVVGYGNRVAEEVRVEACEAAGIPIHRRCSGGGTVLQGPGCFNYALVLRTDLTPGVETIRSANEIIMARQAKALAGLLEEPVQVAGVTDLVWNGRKVSGNAQRRRRSALLFHGTLLLGLDLEAMERYLRMPSREPDYRQGREHGDFVANMDLSRDRLKTALRSEWGAMEPLETWPELAETVGKYNSSGWNRRF